MLYDINGITVKPDLFEQINIECGRANDTSYYFVRIPKTLPDGRIVTPKFALTSDTYNGTKTSALDWATNNEKETVVINAGLFSMNGTTDIPVGVCVIAGIGYATVTPSESGISKYPLCIDDNGDFCSPYSDYATTNATIISNGYNYAVTGWGTPIVDYEVADSTVFYEPTHNNEYIPQQMVGQFQNGDYFVFTCDGERGSVENETGMTYAQVEAILIAKGVKFAYALDGGGSAETVIGLSQINPIYENTTGRPVATVLYFVAE